MNITFSYPTAGDFWLNAGPEVLKHYSCDYRNLTDLPHGDYNFKKNVAIEMAKRFNSHAPVHLLTWDNRLRRNTEDCIVHLQKAAFPPRSFLEIAIEPDVYVPCPEVCFLLAARHLPLEQLVLLGSNLCAGFYLDAEGKICRDRGIITTKALINEYINNAGRNFYGVRTARKALPFVVENAFSPREILLAVVLCLPVEIGGYGLEVPELNSTLGLDDESTAIMGVSELRGDLIWKIKRCVVEYDSTEWHAYSLKRDCDRRTVLQLNGYKVFSIRKEHLANFGTFDATACAIRKYIDPHNMELLDDYRSVRSKLFYRMVKNNHVV